ncbi:hypothetical protein DIPPA_06586 [Diplonema papillatum]|nr:hypothetical protein DIPPA_06586 [Diplonema papillatum]
MSIPVLSQATVPLVPVLSPLAALPMFSLSMRAHKKKLKARVTRESTVGSVKEEAQRVWEVPVARLALSWRGVEMPDNETMGGLGIFKDTTVDLQIRGDRDKDEVNPPRCCVENEFDNVRVMRGHMVIRCRICEKKIRAPLEKVKAWKCEPLFNTGVCPNGTNCPLLHLHFRKRSLRERIELHGPVVLQSVGPSCGESSALKTDSCSLMDSDHDSSPGLSTVGTPSSMLPHGAGFDVPRLQPSSAISSPSHRMHQAPALIIPNLPAACRYVQQQQQQQQHQPLTLPSPAQRPHFAPLQQPWLTSPPTPVLPGPQQAQRAAVPEKTATVVTFAMPSSVLSSPSLDPVWGGAVDSDKAWDLKDAMEASQADSTEDDCGMTNSSNSEVLEDEGDKQLQDILRMVGHDADDDNVIPAPLFAPDVVNLLTTKNRMKF